MWLLASPLAFADPPPPAVHDLIVDQLAAFEKRDAAGAWKHVDPTLQAKFGTADRFLEMVEVGYQPVIAPRSVRFEDFTVFDGEPAQWLQLQARDGNAYRALYLLHQQPDGSWRTSGCLLFAVERPQPSV